MSSREAQARLRDRLLDAQFAFARAQDRSVLVIATGLPAAGRTESLNKLRDWLDPKHIITFAWNAPNDVERAQPWAMRYWQAMPRKAELGQWYDGWYGELLECALDKRTNTARMEALAAHIVGLERMLSADGMRIVKWHFTIDAVEQRRRLKKFARDPLMRWRVTKDELWSATHYEKVARAFARCQALTAHPGAPWKIIDDATRETAFLQAVHSVRLALQKTAAVAARATGWRPPKAHAPILARLNRAMSEPPPEREPDLEPLQARLAHATRHKRWRKRAAVIVFEGMDAAGKSAAIRRIIAALDVRQYRIVPIGAPSAEESSYPYQWRFWRQLPQRGSIHIFDRSWYGRVLVERVRGFAAPADWQRAYDEIVDFERMLGERHITVVKFWLALSKDEQLRRFQAREASKRKRSKVDPEDWKNREHWEEFQVAAADMIALTGRPGAPWTIVPANGKPSARALILRTLCESLEAELQPE